MPKSNVLEIWHFAMRNLALFATQSGISLEVNWQMPFGYFDSCCNKGFFVYLCGNIDYLCYGLRVKLVNSRRVNCTYLRGLTYTSLSSILVHSKEVFISH